MRFCHEPQNVETVRQIADNFAQNHTQRKAAVRCSYDYLTSHARLPQYGNAKFARLSQDKAIRRTVPALYPCGHRAILSCSRTSPRASNRFYQVVEAKRFEGVFLCKKVCRIQNSNSYKKSAGTQTGYMQGNTPGVTRITK